MAANPDPIDVEVGARVRSLRKHRLLSQSSLGDALGLTFHQVQKYERGSDRISASMLIKIADKLEVTVGDLVGERGDTKPPPDVYAKLLIPGASDMLDAYAALPPDHRRALLSYTRSVAGLPHLKMVSNKP